MGNSVFIVISAVLAAAAGGGPETYALQAGSNVWDVAVRDVNGDGKADVLGLCCLENSDPLEKGLAVFLAQNPASDGAGRRFLPEPSLKIPLDASVGVVFFAETDGQPPVEIVAADAEGATVFRVKESQFEVVGQPRFASLFPTGSEEPRFLPKAAEDLDGDTISEWLTPMPKGYAVRGPDALRCLVPCNVTSAILEESGMAIAYHLPACYPFSVEGQSQKALAFVTDEKAEFAYGADWSERSSFKIPLNLEGKWRAAAGLYDLDGNGMPDLVVTQTEGTINMHAVTQVFLASGRFTYPEKPTATFESKGAFAAPLVKDVDGDKKQDLVFVNIPWGVRFFINLFVFKRLGVDLQVYLFKDGGYGATPDFDSTLSIEAPEGRETTAYTMGDFNGDGRMDMAFGAGAGKLEIHVGSEKTFFSAKPWLTLDVPAFGTARVCNLNDNASDDIVIFHPGIQQKDQVEVVVF